MPTTSPGPARRTPNTRFSHDTSGSEAADDPTGGDCRHRPVKQRHPLGQRPEATYASSPDDRLIAFIRTGGLYVMNADGSGQRQVTQVDPDNPDSSPTWSADGTTIVFARGKALMDIQDWNHEFVLEIFSIRADGSGLTRLTRNAAVEDFDPSWRNN